MRPEVHSQQQPPGKQLTRKQLTMPKQLQKKEKKMNGKNKTVNKMTICFDLCSKKKPKNKKLIILFSLVMQGSLQELNHERLWRVYIEHFRFSVTFREHKQDKAAQECNKSCP